MGPKRMEPDKPVIAAVAGPAVAGGFELALWCDVRVMEESAYFGVYCRRWGVPLLDGGTVRLPRLVGTGRARERAEAMAHEIARFPQACMRADRRSVGMQQGLALRAAMRKEWANGLPAFFAEGAAGAKRFADGKGRHGDFGSL